MRNIFAFICMILLIACGPHDITINGLRNSPLPPNLNYQYSEQNQNVQSTPMRSRTIKVDGINFQFQYCTVNENPQICGLVAFTTDSSQKTIKETIYTYNKNNIKEESLEWTFAGRRSYSMLEEILEVYKYDSRSSYVGCNTMFWCPKLGIIYWTNFMHTMGRTTELREHPDKAKLLNLLTAKVRQDKDFFQGCTFVNRIIRNNVTR